MDRQPRMPIGGTAGTGYMLATTGRGLRYVEKVCPGCGRNFRVPPQSETLVPKPNLDRSGQEVPEIWYASTRETRINKAQEYRTTSRMRMKDAIVFFTQTLGLLVAPKQMGGLTPEQAREWYARALQEKELRVYRKLPAPVIDECRKCYRNNLKASQKSWENETIIIRSKKGTRITAVKILTPNKPEVQAKAKRKRVAKPVEEVRIWYCTTPSTREEPSRTVHTDKPMTLHDAKAYFRFHLSRLNLSGCSITG